MEFPFFHREKSVLLSSNRKLERKIKELSLQLDEERQSSSNQRDQVGLEFLEFQGKTWARIQDLSRKSHLSHDRES